MLIVDTVQIVHVFDHGDGEKVFDGDTHTHSTLSHLEQ